MSHDPLYIELGMRTDVGQVRSHNEDSIRTYHADQYEARGGRLFIVADGVGGESFGEVASEMAANLTGEKYYQFMGENGDLPEGKVLRRVLAQVNRDIFEEATNRNAAGHMATTIVAAVLRQSRLVVGWVGDSRAYLIVPNQGIQQITHDHTMVEDKFRRGELTAEEAAIHPHRNVLSRSMGGNSEVAVDVVHGQVYPGFILVMCSDGLNRHVPDDEIAAHATNGLDLMQVAEDLVQLANERGGKDNISVILVRFGNLDEIAGLDASTDVHFEPTEESIAVESLPQPKEVAPAQKNEASSWELYGNRKKRRQMLLALSAFVVLAVVLVIIVGMFGDSTNDGVTNDPRIRRTQTVAQATANKAATQTAEHRITLMAEGAELTDEPTLAATDTATPIPTDTPRVLPPIPGFIPTTEKPIVTLSASNTPFSRPNWQAGDTMTIVQAVGLSASALSPSDEIHLQPGDEVKMSVGNVGNEGETREWYITSDSTRWWYVYRESDELPTSGWVPEHTLRKIDSP